MSNLKKVAVVGATGLVGGKMIEVLQELNFPVGELIPCASEKSVGKKVKFAGKDWSVVSLADGVAAKPDFALFSAGAGVSLEWAPRFAEVGCRVIDNSSCWRMDPTKKLVVPSINGNVIGPEDMIIANPNCSTIQMVLALAPLHARYKIKRIVVSTYQSVTGSGMKGIHQMLRERGEEALDLPNAYPHQIDRNILPHIDSFLENGYTKEEMKMVNETCKIFADDSIKVTATTVRVPVTGGHSESINVEFEKDFDLDEIKAIYASGPAADSLAPGCCLCDDPSHDIYPMPINAFGRNEVFVGRLRRDFSQPNSLNMWVVADNLRIGAATNAVNIALSLL
ncbi:MAG: aspartate-semialdehyde dehydrogenase [Bacteroidales bacterium]|nr:aspartate-semialdehyde dehydrogenase [Bacteroidales bacterium]